MRILVADDEPAILDGLVGIIKDIPGLDIDVMRASDGKEALKILRKYPPDVSILDIEMPKMSGLEVAKEMFKWHLCDRCYILTAYPDFEYAQQAIRYNVKDYILKPINKEYLITLIKQEAMDLGFILNEEDKVKQERDLSDIEILNFALMNTGGSNLINDIIAYIDKNYREDLSLSYIGDIYGKHPNYISTLFKKETNTGFLKYLHTVRLKHAIIRLVNSTDSIKYISQQVGYSEPREFAKLFKKKTGLTPTELREKYRREDNYESY